MSDLIGAFLLILVGGIFGFMLGVIEMDHDYKEKLIEKDIGCYYLNEDNDKKFKWGPEVQCK